jgi:hypothetical protein
MRHMIPHSTPASKTPVILQGSGDDPLTVRSQFDANLT